LPERFERIVQSWDTANKATELADFSVCTSWGIAGKHLYLLDVLRERFDYPELKRRVKDEHRRWRADVVLIEDKASGTQLIQELLDEGMHAATRYRPQANNIMRIYAQTAMIENGFVHLPETAPWLALYLYELSCLPYGRHDDQAPRTPCSGGDGADARLVQGGRARRRHLRLLPHARREARRPGTRLSARRPGARRRNGAISALRRKSSRGRYRSGRASDRRQSQRAPEVWKVLAGASQF
jgi:predicted phage terminase large subunit-like protein